MIETGTKRIPIGKGLPESGDDFGNPHIFCTRYKCHLSHTICLKRREATCRTTYGVMVDSYPDCKKCKVGEAIETLEDVFFTMIVEG